ncbi:hypothetical protein GCM10027036_05750 [Flavihumibacter cheonanensis]|jgi:hypothetical protein|uniref:hypothetical protein n=1 Tax=Flavihumibacter cheonanensis TaxID=1442385 RepID=UPI001EF81756|nr:hypothetical protein [Flavihumibacter cheonanensis]MCG7751981.1 hypothetical protein [Flavihumibacter cheonanensis]
MRAFWIALGCLFFSFGTQAQELYVFTDPASNLPAQSLSAKLTARFADLPQSGMIRQRYMPELMAGLHKNWMGRVSTTFSNFYQSGQRWESVKGYVKWRFFSEDGIHRHFRMAAFADAAFSRNNMIYDEMNLDGDNSGIQFGLIGTQLLHKLAISGTASYIRVFDEKFKTMRDMHDQDALMYSLSAGYLLFPTSYSAYEQVNLNLYVEVLGMKGLGPGTHYLDIAPSIQLIFNSSTKLNLGARLEASGNATRIARNNYFLSLESTFLNVWKKRGK